MLVIRNTISFTKIKFTIISVLRIEIIFILWGYVIIIIIIFIFLNSSDRFNVISYANLMRAKLIAMFNLCTQIIITLYITLLSNYNAQSNFYSDTSYSTLTNIFTFQQCRLIITYDLGTLTLHARKNIVIQNNIVNIYICEKQE